MKSEKLHMKYSASELAHDLNILSRDEKNNSRKMAEPAFGILEQQQKLIKEDNKENLENGFSKC